MEATEPPKSPSWIRSYSVNSQGPSPLPSPKVQANEGSQLEAVPTASILESKADTSTTVEDMDERLSAPEPAPEIVVEQETSTEEVDDAQPLQESATLELEPEVELAAAVVITEVMQCDCFCVIHADHLC